MKIASCTKISKLLSKKITCLLEETANNFVIPSRDSRAEGV